MEKKSANHITNKRLVYRIYKEFSNSTVKKQTKKKWAVDMNRHIENPPLGKYKLKL